MDNEIKSAQDLFGNRHFLEPKKVQAISERAGLVKFFVDTFHLNPARLGPKLAHIKTPDLYPLISQVKDRLNRQDLTTARKYFWWAIGTEEVKDS